MLGFPCPPATLRLMLLVIARDFTKHQLEMVLSRAVYDQMDSWLGNRRRIIVLNREDMISTEDRNAWATYFANQGTKVVFANGQLGMVRQPRSVLSANKLGLSDWLPEACAICLPPFSLLVFRVQ